LLAMEPGHDATVLRSCLAKNDEILLCARSCAQVMSAGQPVKRAD
jgi:hypothetical protein